MKNRFRLVIVVACGLFAWGGAVNFGPTGFLAATPMIGLLIYAAFKYERIPRITAIAFLGTAVLLSGLNVSGILLSLSPATGKEIVLAKPACSYSFPDSELFTFQSPAGTNSSITNNYQNEQGELVRTTVECTSVPAGAKYRVARVEIADHDFGYSYIARFVTETGTGDVRPDVYDPLFTFPDGKPLTQESLQIPIAHELSMLMYWPMLPLKLFNAP